ncbi:MAG: hypothetical protein J6Z11_10665, partial [Candidatus Riflebacteria bacterium]|nr:hypothetical protein [Candidatus Riflebacteria bacterium]
KEFQEKIKSGSELTEELLDHKLNCKSCQEWVIKEVSTAPEGMSNKQWESKISKFSSIETNTNKKDNDTKDPDNKPLPSSENTENKTIKKDTKPVEKEKSFSDYYFSGLKYGIVFGLAIVVGFSILQVKNEKKQSSNANINTVASDSANIASNTNNLSIATDSEIIQLPMNLH